MLDDLWVGKVYAAVFAGLCILVGVGLGYLLFRPDPRDSAALDRNAREMAVVDTVRVIEQARTDTVLRVVERGVTRWRTDTLWRQDTLRLPGDTTPRTAIPDTTLHRMDRTIRACELLSGRVLAERTACAEAIRLRDERIQLLERPDPWWKRRLGCAVGPSAVVAEGAVRVGAGASCGVKF